MHRRTWIQCLTISGAATIARAALSAPPVNARRAPIRAICFDLFTIFDPRGVVRVADAIAPERGLQLWNSWKTRQFEYSWLRAAAGKYVDFETVTAESLVYAARDLQLTLSRDDQRRLVESYSELEPWPDSRDALLGWKRAGFRLATLANYSPKMIHRLLARSQFEPLFELLISTDRARTYKPDPRAYALGPALLGLPRERVAFAAFGGWDAAGGKWFGLPTFWVNRLSVTQEELVAADGAGPNFAAFDAWLAQRGRQG